MKTHKWSGRYSIAGGHVELGEGMVDALKREIKEETGLHIRDARLFSISESVFDPVFWRKRHFIFIDFVCRTGSTRVRLNDESEQFRWVTPKESEGLDMDKYTRRLIREYRTRASGRVRGGGPVLLGRAGLGRLKP